MVDLEVEGEREGERERERERVGGRARAREHFKRAVNTVLEAELEAELKPHFVQYRIYRSQAPLRSVLVQFSSVQFVAAQCSLRMLIPKISPACSDLAEAVFAHLGPENLSIYPREHLGLPKCTVCRQNKRILKK